MIHRVLAVWAATAAELCPALARCDPRARVDTFELGGGHVVLTGGFVNRAMAVGLERPMSDAEFDELERRSEGLGLPPSIEVTAATTAETVDRARARGFRPHAEISALRRDVGRGAPVDRARGGVTVEPADLATWQDVSATGWGYETDDGRRIGDAFAAASYAVDPESLLLARDAEDRRPLGCALLTVRDGVATLGGMTTIPAERGRGVQSALIVGRVRRALDLGADLLTSTAAAGSASERNLVRHGFEPWFTISVLTRQARARDR